ncbi:MAG TPA: hypothetical protein VEA37_02620 [Flavobacterium sp.]|nr:hypothetical protein [Flavobacterium sp.]
MKFNWEEIVVGAIAGPLANVGAEQFAAILMKIEPFEARQTILTSMYPPVDVQLEELAAKSKTKLDNPFVDAIKRGIEMAAEESGIELPNLDEGTKGD